MKRVGKKSIKNIKIHNSRKINQNRKRFAELAYVNSDFFLTKRKKIRQMVLEMMNFGGNMQMRRIRTCTVYPQLVHG